MVIALATQDRSLPNVQKIRSNAVIGTPGTGSPTASEQGLAQSDSESPIFIAVEEEYHSPYRVY